MSPTEELALRKRQFEARSGVAGFKQNTEELKQRIALLEAKING